ncbi:uncharacterized protein [Henckelia pumila]|uniref:uncharacterized protein n=1 Tax=Henckelia pumila TaxID=405737 RepID=UPI003C6DC435
MTSFRKIPMFSKEDFDDWKIRMQAHLSALEDDMWFVITDGPLEITKVNTAIALSGGGPQYIEKPRIEWTAEEKKKANLDNVAKDIFYKTLDKNTFSKIKTCKTGKEIWEKLIQLCEGNEQTNENKLSVATKKFNIKMRPGESMTEFDERVSNIVIELNRLGKTYPNREVILKVIRGLPKEWDVKTMAMRESKDLKKLELHDLFADLKAYEFELQTQEEDQSTSKLTKALTAVKIESSAKSEKSAEQLSSDAMSLFDINFIADCPKPKNFDKRKSSRNDRYISRQKHEALVAKDSKTKWAETDSDSKGSNGSSSSSDDEEEVKCLMANDHEFPFTNEQVFDFGSEKFIREELIKALHDMANEYHQLSLAFDEVRAKQKDLQDNSTELSFEQSVEISCLETEIVVLRTKNEQLKIDIKNLTTEKHNMDEIIRSWNKYSSLLTEMNDSQRPLHDKTGLGFGKTVETSESSTLPKLNMCKGKYINFVRAVREHEDEKPILMTWQQIEQMNIRRFGIGFNPHETKAEIAKSPKQTNAYQPNIMRGNRNQYHNQHPVKKQYRNIKDIGKGKQHIVSQAHYTPLSRASNLVRTYRNTETGKLVKVFQEIGIKKKEEESWYLDSGCSRHMTGNDKLLSELVEFNGPIITFGNNSKGKIVDKGKIIHDNIIIQDVVLVETLKYNLLSISQICDYGHSVEFEKLNCIIKDASGNIILTGNRYGNTYKVCWNIQSSKPFCLVASNSKRNWIWHKRLNHLNFKSISSLSKLKLVTGLPKIDFSKDKVCSACQYGKQVRSSFKNKGYNSSSRCLELLHMDLFGPIPVTSLGGMSKAYRVFNKRTLNVEESIHVIFDEDLTIDVATNTHQLSDLFQEIQLDNDNQDESEDEASTPTKTLQSPEPELVDPVVEDLNIDQSVDTHQTHIVEDIEEQHHKTTELDQNNVTSQDPEAQVISGNQSNTRLKWSKKHPLNSVIGNPLAPLRTRGQMIKELLHAAFISQEEPKKIE